MPCQPASQQAQAASLLRIRPRRRAPASTWRNTGRCSCFPRRTGPRPCTCKAKEERPRGTKTGIRHAALSSLELSICTPPPRVPARTPTPSRCRSRGHSAAGGVQHVQTDTISLPCRTYGLAAQRSWHVVTILRTWRVAGTHHPRSQRGKGAAGSTHCPYAIGIISKHPLPPQGSKPRLL